jgi:hypothetical protein
VSPETHREEAGSLAKVIADVWNGLARDHGWPATQNAEDIKRNRRVLATAMRGWAKTSEVDHGRDTKTLIRWMLSRWNWDKSPAPMNLVASSAQWDALKASLQREVEENATRNKDRLKSVTEWVEKEISVRGKNGIEGIRAREEIEEFAKATGKINAWTPAEQEHFYEELKKCR